MLCCWLRRLTLGWLLNGKQKNSIYSWQRTGIFFEYVSPIYVLSNLICESHIFVSNLICESIHDHNITKYPIFGYIWSPEWWPTRWGDLGQHLKWLAPENYVWSIMFERQFWLGNSWCGQGWCHHRVMVICQETFDWLSPQAIMLAEPQRHLWVTAKFKGLFFLNKKNTFGSVVRHVGLPKIHPESRNPLQI